MSSKAVPVIAHLLFWAWNALFISVVFIGLAPMVFYSLFIDVMEGFTPPDFAATAMALLLVPPLCTALGFFALRTQPRKLFALLYGVEGPVMVLLLTRLFLIRELTAATTYVLALLLAGGAVYAYGIFREPHEKPSRAAAAGQLAAHGVLLVSGLYLAALISFYAVPAGAAFLTAFFSFDWVPDIFRTFEHVSALQSLYFLFMSILMASFFSVTVALFVAMPFVLIGLYLRRWVRVFGRARVALGATAATAITTACVALAGYGFVRSNEQPQRAVIARLEQTPATDAERRALLDDREAIREGLLNAYLAPYRYVSPVDTDRHISSLFERNVGLSEENARWVESLFHVLAMPMLYEGDGKSTHDERVRASALYEAFFDEPIQKGEKDTVLRALNATFDRSGREAGLLDEGGRKVLLERQDLVITEHATHAEVELHEVYANQTYEQQEVFYSFSLPESAVVTGLWLGDTDDRNKRFPYVLATRGAAQAVYKAEVQRRVDPALLEQVGPRQYRLRAFPIPPRSRFDRGRGWTPDPLAPPPPDRMHLWLTFRVLPDDGAWPMPRAFERRNVYATSETERRLNAGPLVVESDDDWLPRAVPAVTALARGGATIALTATDAIRAEPLPAQRPTLPAGRRFAVVLDRSYSMGRHVDALARGFEWMASEVQPHHQLDLYFMAGSGRGESAVRIDQPRGFDPRDVVYFGGQDPTAMIADFVTLRGQTRYDAILFLTDEGSYALAKDAEVPRDLGAPVWFVHVGGALPPGYDDGTLELIQASGGGVTTALPRVFTSLAYASTPGFVAVDDDFVWTRVPAADDAGADHPLAPFAARQLLLSATRSATKPDLAALDGLHALARRYSIVSPYSSMIVLVNDEQRRALAAAEAAEDRFDREVERGVEQLSTPSGGFPVVTATPEPEEWALIIVSCLGLLMIARQQRARRHTWTAV